MIRLSSGLTTGLLVAFLALVLAVSACTALGGRSAQDTPTPAPTSSIPDMQVIAPQACQVAEQSMIRVEQPQGDLVSWSPGEDTVAYIAPTLGSSWNVGEMYLLSAPKFDAPLRLASSVAGEITWAPGASAIAYLELRRSDNLYTIGLAYPDGRPSTDLFPDEAARTDDYSSMKAILEWMDADRLRVLTSCGDDCMQTLDINVHSSTSSPVAEPLQKSREMWAAHTNNLGDLSTSHPALPGQLNWSWDAQRIAYIDEIGNAWVINAGSDSLYPLDIGQYGSATETDWSSDSRYLAVQVDQKLKIFSFVCP